MPIPRRATQLQRSNNLTGRKNSMDIHLAGSRPTRRAPSDWFTGTVWQDPINTPPAPARVNSGGRAFETGARTAWHTHPLGQTLFVTFGVGMVQTVGGPVREIRP